MVTFFTVLGNFLTAPLVCQGGAMGALGGALGGAKGVKGVEAFSPGGARGASII